MSASGKLITTKREQNRTIDQIFLNILYMDDQPCSCCISAPTYCIIDLEPAMMNTIMQHLYGTGGGDFLPDQIWSSSKCSVIRMLLPCVPTPALPSGPALVIRPGWFDLLLGRHYKKWMSRTGKGKAH